MASRSAGDSLKRFVGSFFASCGLPMLGHCASYPPAQPMLTWEPKERDSAVADIFVSYSRADKARVVPLVAALEAQGWSVWWDPEITPGDEFDSLIGAELEAARAVVVVWTRSS